MRQLAFVLALLTAAASAQSKPDFDALGYSYDTGVWTVIAGGAGGTPVAFLPTPVALYCQNSSGQTVPWTAAICGGGGGGGSVSLTSPGSTLSLSPSPITGTGTLDLNLAHANTWTATQSFAAIGATSFSLSNSNGTITLGGSYLGIFSTGASSTNTPVQFQGVSSWQAFKDATPTFAYGMGYEVPGGSSGNNPIFSIYNGTSWSSTWFIDGSNNLNLNANLIAEGITYPTTLTSGGILYGSSATQLTSSAALTHYGVIYGGGAGGAPVSTAADTTTTHALFATATAPAFRAFALTDLPSQTANTVLGALTATTPSGLAVPSCSGASNALIWTSGTGFGCNTISTGGIAFPATVSGTTTSGGIPYFSSTTVLTSSALLATSHVLLGGGAGGAPTSDSKLDDGATTANTLTYTGTGGIASGGPVSSTGPAGDAGYVYLVGNTANQAFVANTVGFMGAPSASFTGYALQLPATGPTNTNNTLQCGTPTSNISTCSFAAVAASLAFPLTVSGTTTSGGIPYFSSTTALTSSAILNTNVLVKGGGAGGAPTNSSVTDNGTTVTSTDTGGYVAPVFVANGTTAGFIDFPQGTTSAAVAPCNTATSICEQAPTTVTSYTVTKPGAGAQGTRIESGTSSALTESFSGDSNHTVHTIGSTASISTATLCAATAGTACGQAGQYRISYNIWGSGTACSSVTAGKVVFTLSWTDENGNAQATVPLSIWETSAANTNTANTTGTYSFTTALTTEAAWGDMVISTNGTVIQYATTYTACTTGTGTYNFRFTAEPLQ